MSETLAVSRAIQNKSSRFSALRELVKYMPEVLSETLEVARSIQDKSSRLSALSDLAEYIPELMSEALTLVYSIQNETSRADVLSKLIPKFKVIETDFAVWQDVVHTLAHRNRKSFLEDIPKLAPAMISLCGGDKTVLNLVVEAMRDVCRQWP